MTSHIGRDIAVRRRVAAGDLGIGTLHDQSTQASDVGFRQRRADLCKLSNVTERIVMVDRFQMILELLATDRDAVLVSSPFDRRL